jgi:hypothetical protein
MLAMLFFGGIVRCASPQSCPSDAEIITAARNRDVEAVYGAVAQGVKEGMIVSAHALPITGISEVLCGRSFAGNANAVTCKFTIRYPGRNAYFVAQMQNRQGAWVIDSAEVLYRDRR